MFIIQRLDNSVNIQKHFDSGASRFGNLTDRNIVKEGGPGKDRKQEIDK